MKKKMIVEVESGLTYVFESVGNYTGMRVFDMHGKPEGPIREVVKMTEPKLGERMEIEYDAEICLDIITTSKVISIKK